MKEKIYPQSAHLLITNVFIKSYLEAVGKNICQKLIMTLITFPVLQRESSQVILVGLTLFLFTYCEKYLAQR